MMDDDEEKHGVTQIPLMHDMVFDSSLPLKPPKRKASGPKKPKNYSPDYDPDTIDLFGDINMPVDVSAANDDNQVAENHSSKHPLSQNPLSQNPLSQNKTPADSGPSKVYDTKTDNSTEREDGNAASPTVPQDSQALTSHSERAAPEPIDPGLRGELTNQLASILDDLADQKPG